MTTEWGSGREEGEAEEAMKDVRSWWEVPCIAHFCSLFRASFDLPDFDIEELEEALVSEEEEVGTGLLQDLILRLLKGCSSGCYGDEKDEISSSNYQMYLRRLFRLKCEEDVRRKNPFDSDLPFHSLPLRTKVEILSDLTDFRLDANDITDLLKSIEAESLRVSPLGRDSGGSTYWYFYGTRLYREDYTSPPKGPPKKRGRGGGGGGVRNKWQVVCFTEQDWQLLNSQFKNCKHKDERGLHQRLQEDFLPELARLFAEKEKVMRSRMMEKQLRRKKVRSPSPSNSMELALARKEQEEADRRLAEEIEREERKGNLRERRGGGARPALLSRPPPPPKEPRREPKGRMTNNSLATPLPPEPEEPEKREEKKGKKSPPKEERKSGTSSTKVKSSVLFCGSMEDIEIGMHKVVEAMKGREDSWPFLSAVEEEFAPNYYKVIREPISIDEIEENLNGGRYASLEQFRADWALLFANCHKYNGESSEYTEMAESLEAAFEKAIRHYILPDDSDDEINIEYGAQNHQPKAKAPKRVKKKMPSPSKEIKVEIVEEKVVGPERVERKKKRKKSRSPKLTSQTLKSVERKWKKKASEESRLGAKPLKPAPPSPDKKRKWEDEEEEELAEREEREERRKRALDGKDKPVKKRPRLHSPSPPPSKHHSHHHHHKHSRAHQTPPAPKSPTPAPATSPGQPTPPKREPERAVKEGGSGSESDKKKKKKGRERAGEKGRGGKGRKPNGGSLLSGLLGMKRLQVGKATKFKINRTVNTDMDHSKTKEREGGRGEEGAERERKRCLLLQTPLQSTNKLSFGTVLPKHALRPFKGPVDEGDQDEVPEPLPEHPTQEDILERLEKTFGASLARKTKDSLAKALLSPDEPLTLPLSDPQPPSPRLEPNKPFDREKSLPNLSAWLKAFGGVKPGDGAKTPSATNPPSPGDKAPEPAAKPKFMVMGRGIGEWKGAPKAPAPLAPDTPQPEQEPKKEEPEEGESEKEERKRRTSTSSLSSQSEHGSPSCFEPPRWAESRAEVWGSPSASSQVSSHQSPAPAGPNSPFSPSVSSPPNDSPQTPPQATPVRVGFYQDYNNSSPEKTADLNVTSPATPPTPAYTPPRPYNLTAKEESAHAQHQQQQHYTPLRAHPEYRLEEIRGKGAEGGMMGTGGYPAPAPTPPSYHSPIYIPEAHGGGARYALPQSHAQGQEPQAAHQQYPSREGVYPSAPYAHHHAHALPPRGMNVYNNPNLYKRGGSEGLAPSALTLVTGSGAGPSGGRRKETKGPAAVELNGFQWPHGLASLTQIVNSIPNPMSGYIPGHYAHPNDPIHHRPEAGYTSLSPSNNQAGRQVPEHAPKARDTPPISTAPSSRARNNKSSESKGSRGSKSSGSSGGGGQASVTSGSPLVPGSAFNFSALTPAELALYSKEMSEYGGGGGRSDLYPTSTPSFHPGSFSSGAVRGSSPSPYQLGPFHPSAYGSSRGTFSPSPSPRTMVDPYGGLFQPSPHVMGLLPPTTHYPSPYPHPHALPFPNRPGWI